MITRTIGTGESGCTDSLQRAADATSAAATWLHTHAPTTLGWDGPVVDALDPNDFYNTTYATLFDLITTQVRAGRPHDPASIVSAITIAGGGHHAQLALRTLTDVTIAGAGPESAGHYAAAAYRRGCIAAAVALTQAATELAEADLFEHLLTIGRERRTALQRLEQLRDTLGH